MQFRYGKKPYKRLPQEMQVSQFLITIKRAKAYNFISYDASCFLAGIKPIGLKFGAKTCL